MIVNDQPPGREMAEHDREQTAALVAMRELQAPAAVYDGALRAEQLRGRFLKRQRAHFAAVALVTLTVPGERRRPPFRDGGVRVEREVGRVPVPSHIALQILRVP